jgi:hypothetical protein
MYIYKKVFLYDIYIDICNNYICNGLPSGIIVLSVAIALLAVANLLVVVGHKI